MLGQMLPARLIRALRGFGFRPRQLKRWAASGCNDVHQFKKSLFYSQMLLSYKSSFVESTTDSKSDNLPDY